MLKRLAAVTLAQSARLQLVLVFALLASPSTAQEDAATVTGSLAATGTCDAPVVLEPGVHSVHCISPAIRMTPGQVSRLFCS